MGEGVVFHTKAREGTRLDHSWGIENLMFNCTATRWHQVVVSSFHQEDDYPVHVHHASVHLS